MPLMRTVQMAIVQVVNVIVMNDCRVSTALAVHVRMIVMCLMCAHCFSFIPEQVIPAALLFHLDGENTPHPRSP